MGHNLNWLGYALFNSTLKMIYSCLERNKNSWNAALDVLVEPSFVCVKRFWTKVGYCTINMSISIYLLSICVSHFHFYNSSNANWRNEIAFSIMERGKFSYYFLHCYEIKVLNPLRISLCSSHVVLGKHFSMKRTL